MKQFLLILLIVLLIGLVVFLLFVGLSSKPGTEQGIAPPQTVSLGNGSSLENTPPVPEPTSSTTTLSVPQGNTFTIETPSGAVSVHNFYQDNPEISGPYVILRETNDYDIQYLRTNSHFLIALLDFSNDQDRVARAEAEDQLLTILGVTKAEACELNVSVAVPIGDNPDLAGPNYGLSFCPNGISF